MNEITTSDSIKNELERDYDDFLLFYAEIKMEIIESDLIDKDKSTSLIAINELRNAFDHLYRSHIVSRGLIEQIKNVTPNYEPPDDEATYCKTHLNKAWAHLYRAGYDACEVICLTLFRIVEGLREKINSEYNIEEIIEIIPDFYKEMSVLMNEALEENAEARALKDIDQYNTVRRREDERKRFDKYRNIVKNLKNMKEKLESSLVALDDFAKKNRKEKRRRTIKGVIIGIIISLIAGICLYSLTTTLSKDDNKTKIEEKIREGN